MFFVSVNALFLSVENMLPNEMIWKNFIELRVNNFMSCRLFVKSYTIHVVNAVPLMHSISRLKEKFHVTEFSYFLCVLLQN